MSDDPSNNGAGTATLVEHYIEEYGPFGEQGDIWYRAAGSGPYPTQIAAARAYNDGAGATKTDGLRIQRPSGRPRRIVRQTTTVTVEPVQ